MRALTREWFTLAELAELRLPGLPETERGLRLRADSMGWRQPNGFGTRWRQRAGSGGGTEYHFHLLPAEARLQWLERFVAVDGAAEHAAAKAAGSTDAEIWSWFTRQAEAKQAQARLRLSILQKVAHLEASGRPRLAAAEEVCREHNISLRTFYNWDEMVRGVPRHDWLPHLAPRHAGSKRRADISPDAWDFIQRFWLSPSRPTFKHAFRELESVAAAQGWTIPSEQTLRRRLEAIPAEQRVMAREGKEAAGRMLPAQRRTRKTLRAMEAVNADGHTFDLFVRWLDGSVIRPVLVAFQDLHSNKILSWRIERTENSGAVRLAFGDMVDRFGIPEHCIFDNGRHFASKKLTGGTANRYRFKVREEDPDGMLTVLGVKVHFTTPYHGQAKPIERFFGDVAREFVRHPEFEGAWTGGNPNAKPENYGKAAVPYDLFIRRWTAWLIEYNARAGRETEVCGGRLSFDAAFEASWREHEANIRRPAPHHRHLWLLAAETITVRQDSTIHLLGNRYHAPFLTEYRGQKVTIRFDPENVHQPLMVYRTDQVALGEAACIDDTGFLSQPAARESERNRKEVLRAARQGLAARRRMTVEQMVAMKPEPDEPAPMPAPRIVQLVRGNTALRATVEEQEREYDRTTELLRRGLRATRNGPQLLRVVEDEA